MHFSIPTPLLNRSHFSSSTRWLLAPTGSASPPGLAARGGPVAPRWPRCRAARCPGRAAECENDFRSRPGGTLTTSSPVAGKSTAKHRKSMGNLWKIYGKSMEIYSFWWENGSNLWVDCLWLPTACGNGTDMIGKGRKQEYEMTLYKSSQIMRYFVSNLQLIWACFSAAASLHPESAQNWPPNHFTQPVTTPHVP